MNLMCTFVQGTLVPLGYAQESKPDEAVKQTIPRAGENGIGMPVCIKCPPPEYSKKGRAAKLQGIVSLEITVSTEGRVTNIIVVKALGGGLEEKAIKAVKSWKFKPATDSYNKPIAVRVPIEVTFHFY